MNSIIKPRYGRTLHKKGWRALLSPGWVLFTLSIIAFSYFAFTFLAPWQLNRDGVIVERNEQIDAAFEVDPVPVEDIVDADGAIDPEEEWARVILTGRYLPTEEVVMRMRPVDSSPAFHALTPFQLASGKIILVNRGFEPPFQGGVPPLATAPTGEQSILGHARLNEQRPSLDPIYDQGVRQVYGINTDQIEQITGTDLARDYVQLAPDEAGEINAIPIPILERGSHLSYAFQWIAFGIMAPLGLGYFLWAELRERRRVRREQTELAESLEHTADTLKEETDSPTADQAQRAHQEKSTDATISEAADRRARKMHNRYGDSQPNHYRKLPHRESERF